jgi:GWxTD domain-containing protein
MQQLAAALQLRRQTYELHQDRAYIITPQEREAFQKLQTEEERKQFIEQFRQRQDLTSGTPQTEAVLRELQELSAALQLARQTPLTAYDKWLQEDVAYIMTDQERAAFQKLQTDKERDQFIEQFWLRRDPTPGTAQNEFKEEHYRRIAYANFHFGFSGTPGWKADRGRIYIQFGPPDEKDEHPSGGAYLRPPAEGGGEITTLPFEDWRYRYIEGIGNDVTMEFVDGAKTGEYRMTRDPNEKNQVFPLQRAVPGSPK